MFRTANERTTQWDERHADSDTELYFCECADTACREKVSVRKEDYERVRSDSCQFVIVPGHDIPDVETVIEVTANWAIVEKQDEVAETVKRLDPR